MESEIKSKLSRQQLEAIVKTHFSNSELLEVNELTDGNISSVYILKGTGHLEKPVVLKTGMPSGVEGLRYEKELFPTEGKVYELLQDKGLPIPRVLGGNLKGMSYQNVLSAEKTRTDLPEGRVDFPYLLMEYVEGCAWVNYLNEVKASRLRLMEKLGYYDGVINQVTGPYFGYLKEGEKYHFPTWGDAFSNMMSDILLDGREKGFELPYMEIEEILNGSLELLNQIVTPKLVDFDLWAGNVFLRRSEGKENQDEFEISGIIDFGHCFFGDPFAGFISAVHILKDVEEEPEFRKGYEKAVGRSLVVTENDRIRMNLYRLYMALLCTVETYRYEPVQAEKMRNSLMRKVEELVKILGEA